MNYDVLVIGAGPIGSTIAEKLHSFGLKTLLADKKTEIGKHACSGLISKRITEYVSLDEDMVENVIEGAIFHTRGTDFEVNKKSPTAFVVDRPKFDRSIFNKAIGTGLDYGLGMNFKACSKKEDGYRCYFDTRNGMYTVDAKLIIGADGAASPLRTITGLQGSLRFVNGIISYFPVKDDSKLVELFYGPNTAPGFFAWRIPRGTRVEYGLATNQKYNHLEYFRQFLSRFKLTPGRFYAHPICFGNQKTVADNLMLIGDAAAQVKPFSGGGIIYGLISAQIAAKGVVNAFDEEDLSESFLKSQYEDKWKEKLIPKIEIGMGIRNILDNLSDRELDTFFSTLKDHKDTLESFGDMDFL